ncbi:MAG: lactonase family protein, partial [Bryobacterales bacterium]|nr:lactonase family protein [Bryobacterales bacterium]
MKTQRFLLVTVLLSLCANLAGARQFLMFVGTYTGHGSRGIYTYRFDSATGDIAKVGLAAQTDDPSFLAVDSKGRFLYAVNELDKFKGEPTGAISTFEINRDTGTLDFLQQVSSLGAAPAYLSLDKTERFVLVANYGSGNVAVFPIKSDGTLGASTAFDQHSGSSLNKRRQSGPHAHSILVSKDNRFALSADLGTDQLFVYRFDAQKGTLAPNTPAFVKVVPGSGPRHMAFAPDAKWVFLANEMAATVTAFAYDAQSGVLAAKHTVSTVSESFQGQNLEAEIATDMKGEFLYVSNRGEDSVTVFRINSAD